MSHDVKVAKCHRIKLKQSALVSFCVFFFHVCSLQWIHSLSPKAFVLVEADANLNSPFFLQRMEEIVQRGARLYESWDSMLGPTGQAREVMEFLFQTDMTNTVACEGLHRFLRLERMEQWENRLITTGFSPLSFPDEAWQALGHLQSMDRRLSVVRAGYSARLLCEGTPHLFASAWKP